MMRTVQLAVADARARGLDLELRAVDDRESEVIAASAAAELVADPSVIAVIGHKNSGPSGAAGPVYAEAGLTQITQCSTDNSLSRAGWPTFFRLCADNERQAAIAADFAYSLHGSGRAVAVHDGTDYGRPLVEAFATRLRTLSGRDVAVLAMRVGQEDFTDVVDAIRAAHAGVVDVGATEIESSKLMRALRGAGVGAQFISSGGGHACRAPRRNRRHRPGRPRWPDPLRRARRQDRCTGQPLAGGRRAHGPFRRQSGARRLDACRHLQLVAHLTKESNCL